MPSATSSSRASASLWEWAQTALLAANLVWTTLYMGGYRPFAQAITLVLTALLVLVHVAARVFEARRVPLHPAAMWFLPFLAYAAINVIGVAPAAWLGWLDWLTWAEMVAVFWVVLNGIRAGPTRQALVLVLVLLGVVGVLLGCYQRFVRPDWVVVGERALQYVGRASGSFSIPNSLAAWLLLCFPVAAALALRRTASATERVWWGWLAVVFLFGLVLTLSRGAWLAWLFAMTVWPLTRGGWSWRRRVSVSVAILGIAAIAAVGVYRASPRVRERVGIMMQDAGERTRPIMWRGAWALFRENPAVGSGAGSFNVAFEKHRPERFPDTPLWAHNEYLNTLSDYGAVGFLLFFGAAAGLALRCATQRQDETPLRARWVDSTAFSEGLAIGVLAFSAHVFVEFHLKIPALALAFATIGALAVGSRWRVATTEMLVERRRGLAARIGALATAGVLLAAVIIGFLPLLRSEMLRIPARRAMDRLGEDTFDVARYREVLPDAHRALLRATALCSSNGQAWADLAYVSALMPFLEPERTREWGVAAERAADRALACAPRHHEFWIRRGAGRDLQGRWEAAGADFARATELAPANANAWFYYADHLMRLPAAHEAAEAAVAFCLRLDPGNTPGEMLRQRLALQSSKR